MRDSNQPSVFNAKQNNPIRRRDHMGGALTRGKSRDTRTREGM